MAICTGAYKVFHPHIGEIHVLHYLEVDRAEDNVHSPRNSHNMIEVAIDLIFLQRIYPGRFGISALFDDLVGRALYAGLIVSCQE